MNYVECESFLELNSPDILALCEENLDDSIDSGNFSVRGYLPLIRRKDSVITHMHGLVVYLKEGLRYFSISNDLTPMVNFSNRIPDCNLQSWSFGFFSLFWCYYMFNSVFPSIRKIWSCCCLSYHWLSIKVKMKYPISKHGLWLFLRWLWWSLWSFERCFVGWYSDRLVIVAVALLRLQNLHMWIKQKSSSIPRKQALRTFSKLLIMFSVKFCYTSSIQWPRGVVFCILENKIVSEKLV